MKLKLLFYIELQKYRAIICPTPFLDPTSGLVINLGQLAENFDCRSVINLLLQLPRTEKEVQYVRGLRYANALRLIREKH